MSTDITDSVLRWH